MEDDCPGEFNAPVEPSSKCWLCDERLKDHSFYSEMKKERVPSE